MTKFIDQINVDLREQIKKASSQRLCKWIIDSGVSIDVVETLTREQLMETWAEKIFTGKDKPDEEIDDDPYVNEGENENQELALRREELALRREELELKKRELDRNDDECQRKKDMEKTLVHRVKLYADALRGIVTKMPNDAIELVSYFASVDQIFRDFRVEKGLQVHLIKPHLTESARIMIARMEPSKASDYEQVKAMLMHEFKLSPAALLEKFNVIIFCQS